MEAVRIVTGTAVPLNRSDVDTDQIIPASWLKRVERTGFGAGLFSSIIPGWVNGEMGSKPVTRQVRY